MPIFMNKQSYTFVQNLSINGYELDIESIVSLAYTETVDLSGPSIILQLRDAQSIIRDLCGLAGGSTVKLEMGDLYGTGDQHFEERFIVITCPIENDIIKIEGFQRDCHDIKNPAGKPLFFSDKQPRAILAALLPNLVVNCTVSGRGTYHLNQGKSPSRLLRDMARDYGATCWICRGTVYFQKISAIQSSKALLKIGLNSHDADVNIARYNKINTTSLYERVVHKSYSAWLTDSGHKHSLTHKNKPSVLLAYPLTPALLSNQSLYVQPVIDIVVRGDSRFKPSVLFDVEVIKFSADAALDESVESRLFIKAVTHYSESTKYNNRIILGMAHGS
jgi:hypothetical protein